MLAKKRFWLHLALVSVLLVSFLLVKWSKWAKESALIECTGHQEGNIHYHAKLEIFQDDRSMEVPANIGIVGDCIHPLHTHDTSGLIHIDYQRPIRVTMGDFFDLLGTTFRDDQIGSFKEWDGYSLSMVVNGKERKRFWRRLVLRENDNITIRITSPTKDR